MTSCALAMAGAQARVVATQSAARKRVMLFSINVSEFGDQTRDGGPVAS
ncbi:hypothetical protein CP97_14634 [Aurantiacibacter atlanticus]|uniref:Uncharacterized protein n=1 Tax=Aurantiacibacter atlanticus TaxID=1648404 RepID=A0A161IU21_9SPHN|nr:hypothetical protein CP97_14634 [Aurantiacibacter atlanticus]